MIRLNAQDLVNQYLSFQEPPNPEHNLFLSTYTLKGETDLMDAHIENLFIRPNFTLNISKLRVKKAVELESPFPTHLVGFSFNLIGLQLQQISKLNSEPALKPDDEEKIRECERLLTANYNQPQSLLELARSVGLNDFKLKQGFKTIYGKPVFKYLQEYRLNKAYESLNQGQKQVSEVAEEIGFNSIGSFSNAFLSQFGIRPNELKSV